MATEPGRQEGRRAEREKTKRPFSKPTKEGEGVIASAHLLTKTPLPLPLLTLSFRTRPPLLAPGPQDEPLHAATNTKAGAEKPKDISPVGPRKRCDGPRGREGRGRGAEERGSGGNSALAG